MTFAGCSPAFRAGAAPALNESLRRNVSAVTRPCKPNENHRLRRLAVICVGKGLHRMGSGPVSLTSLGRGSAGRRALGGVRDRWGGSGGVDAGGREISAHGIQPSGFLAFLDRLAPDRQGVLGAGDVRGGTSGQGNDPADLRELSHHAGGDVRVVESLLELVLETIAERPDLIFIDDEREHGCLTRMARVDHDPLGDRQLVVILPG